MNEDNIPVPANTDDGLKLYKHLKSSLNWMICSIIIQIPQITFKSNEYLLQFSHSDFTDV